MVSHYLQHFRKDPKSQAFALLAESLRRCDLLDEAIEVCKEGLRHHPQHPAGLFTLARCYIEKEDYQKAAVTLSILVRLVPENLVAQKLLAKTYLKLRQNDMAILPLQFILSHNPQDEEAKALVAQIEASLREQDLDAISSSSLYPERDEMAQRAASFEVKPLHQLWVTSKPVKSALSTETIASIYLRQGFLEKAIGIYKSLLTRHPEDSQLKSLLKELELKADQASSPVLRPSD
ncbi:MAG: tetratricopeptide repeat protein [Deltaproteobacteria bacterium]|nr:tetratricopeptide repeat protein [Deltaproteobacteria bacterium]